MAHNFRHALIISLQLPQDSIVDYLRLIIAQNTYHPHCRKCKCAPYKVTSGALGLTSLFIKNGRGGNLLFIRVHHTSLSDAFAAIVAQTNKTTTGNGKKHRQSNMQYGL